MKKIFILFLFGFYASVNLSAQIKLDAVVGGGSSSMVQYFSDHHQIKINPDYLVNAGVMASTKFRKDGMLGLQLGMLWSYSGFKSYLPDWDVSGQNGNDVIWQSEPNKIRSHFLKIPLTLDFNVYERLGLLFGGHLNLRLSSNEERLALFAIQATDESISGYRKSIAGVHAGVYGKITDRIRLDAKVFNDINSRLYNPGYIDNIQFRELGFSINLNYRLNP